MPFARKLIAALLLVIAGLPAHAQAPTTEAADDAQPAGAAAEPPTEAEDESAASTAPAGDVRVPIGAVAPDDHAAGPDVYLLPDASGQLRRVLGYRYEDFLEAWRANVEYGAAARRPAYAMPFLQVDVTAEEDAAQVRASVEVELLQDGWTQVPLRLGTLIVEEATVEGGASGEHVSFDTDTRSFVGWLMGKSGEKRRLAVTGKALVSAEEEGQRLELALPAALKSSVQLTTPGGGVEVESPADALLTTDPTSADGVVRSRIDGVKGKFAVRWGAAKSSPANNAATMEAVAETVVEASPGRLMYDTRLRINTFGQEIERIRVRLPAGASLSTSQAAAEYDVATIPPAGAGEARTDARQLVEVRFPETTTSPPLIRLAAEQSGGRDSGEALLAASGFEVVGAFRQRSSLALRVSDELHAHFEARGRIQRIDPVELPNAMVGSPVAAAYQASGSTWSIDVFTQPRERRVSVTPRLDMRLGAYGATMDVLLDYQMTGGKTFELRVDLRGWELAEQPIESGGAVDAAQLYTTPEGVLILPMKDPTIQQARVRFAVRREAGLGSHDLPLPTSLDALALPGLLTVACDDPWQATPRLEASAGIASAAEVTSAPANGAAPPTRGSLAPLRFAITQSAARLAVDVDQRPRVIESQSLVTASVGDKSVDVKQELQYEIKYQSAMELAATVDSALLANESLEILVNGKPTGEATVDVLPLSAAAEANGSGKLRLVVRMNKPAIGRVAVTIRSAWPISEAQRAGTSMIAIPLAAPDQVVQSLATVSSAAGGDVQVQLWPGAEPLAWSSESGEGNGSNGSGESLRLSAAKPVDTLPLRLESSGAAMKGDLRVEAVWAQTWIAGGVRQDRVVYRFTTAQDQVRLELPAEYDRDNLEVMLDGKVKSADAGTDELLLIALPEGSGGHTLELRRQTPLTSSSWNTFPVRFPQLRSAGIATPVIWQLVLPRGLALIGTPEGLSREYQGGWRALTSGGEAPLDQAELERWTGASKAQAPTAGANEYVFSALEIPTELHVTIARRAWIVLAAATAALLAGLLWLHTDVGRRPGLWFAICIAVVAMAWSYPELTIIMGQAIAIGGAVAMLSAVTRRLARPAVRRAPASVPPSSVHAHTATTQQWFPERPSGSAPSATPSAGYRPSRSLP